MFASVLLRILAVLLLVAANAFFVVTEFALVSVRSSRIEEMVEAGRAGARTVQKLLLRIDDLLGAVQLGVTLTSLALGWIGEPTVARLLRGAVGLRHVSDAYAGAISIVLAFIVITFLHVVLGELVPKSVALQSTERVAVAVAPPMDVFITLMKPFLVVMRRATRFVLTVLGVKQMRQAGAHSPEELKLIVTAAHRTGTMPDFQEQLMLRALESTDVTVREIMVPRQRIFSLPSDMFLRDALSAVVEEQHSRVPVFDPERGREHIVGLLYSKDVSRWARLRLAYGSGEWATRLDNMRIRDIMRDVLVIPETKPVSDLLAEFKRGKRHLAVVVDEFGSTVGLVTVEDVLEQLVGEIEDEFDVAAPDLAPGTTTLELDGTVNIRDLETLYHVRLPRDQGFDTLAGFLLSQLQRIPRTRDSVEYEGRKFTIEQMEGRRIARVKIELQSVANAQTATPNA